MSKNKTVSKTKNKSVKNLNRYNSWYAWGLAVFSFILYANTIANDYNIDDELVTKNHPLTSQGIKGLVKIFSSPYYADASGNVYEYRPIVLASFAIEHQFFGDSAAVSHFLNALLYGLLIFVLFKLLRSLFENYNLLLPLLATLLFAAHPIHTEVVASIKNRDEILAFLFGILALSMAVKYIKSNKYSHLLLTLLLFLLGILSKKSVLPFALIIPMALIFFKKPNLSQLLYLVVPLSIIGSATSYFFDINIRFLFSFIIILGALFFYLLNNTLSFNQLLAHLKNFHLKYFHNPFKVIPATEITPDQKPIKQFFISLLVVSLVFCFLGAVDNSKYILSIVLITNTLIYLFANSKLKETILISLTFSALLLLTQNGIVSGIMLVVAYLFKNFNYKNRVHQLCFILIFIPLCFNFGKHIVFVFYFIIIGITMLSFQIKKNYLIPKILSLLIAVIFIVINIITNNFQNETLFISLTFIILAISFFLYTSVSKKNIAVVIILLMIPFTILSELVLLKNYNSTTTRIQTVALSKATGIMPASGRALEFAEMPLTKTSPLEVRAGTAFTSMAFYLKMLIIPHPLGFYYGYDMIPIVSISNVWAIVSLLIHLGLFVLALLKFKKNKILSFAILFYLISISIFSNIIAPVAGLIAERLVFTASLGFCIALAFLLLKIFKLNPDTNTHTINVKQGFIGVVIVLTLLYSYKTFSRNTEWKDMLTLYENDINSLDRSAQAHNLYANTLIAYLQKEKSSQKRDMMYNAAIEHFKTALNIYPDFYNASYSLGKAYYFGKKNDEAIKAFEQTLKIDSSDYMTYMYLGIINDENGDVQKSIDYYTKTIKKAPEFLDAYTNLSALYLKDNQAQKAVETNLDYLKIKPDTYDPILNIGKIYFSTGNLPLALEYFDKAYALNNQDKNLINALFEINKKLGNNEKAEFYMNLLKNPRN